MMKVIVFRNRLLPGVETRYGRHAGRVSAIAERMPGFVASKDFTAEDGERATLIEFIDAETLAAWRGQPDHRAAQELGRSEYFEQYSIQICELERESRFTRGGSAADASRADIRDETAGMLAASPLEGGCLCGNVRYRAQGRPQEPSLCHCVTCRRASGAPAVAWATFFTRDLEFTRGAPKRFRSSAKAERGFCGDCGGALVWQASAEPERIDVTIASLDAPELIAPASHIHTRSRLPWLRLADGLPTFVAARPSPDDSD